jgi:hypothetical protein
MAVPALALILAAPAAAATAATAASAQGSYVPAAAAAPWITPANGSTVISDMVTVTAQGSPYGGFLMLDGVRRAAGGRLSYTLDGHRVANGWHHAVAVTSNGGYGNPGPWGGGGGAGYSRSESTFNLAVPPYPPAGVSVSASGTTVKVGWNRGIEPDLTGYSISSKYGTTSASASCSNGRCGTSFKVPAGASGDLRVNVVAKRAGSGPSIAVGASVRLVAPSKPKPRESPIPNVTVQESSPEEAKAGEKDGTGQESNVAVSEPSVEPPEWSPAPGTEVTSVASLESEGKSTSSRLMMAWIFVFIFVLGLLGAHFGAAARRRRRRQEALLNSGPKSRHRRQPLALGAGPDVVLKWNETVRLDRPIGRAHDAISSAGHASDSDVDIPTRWA